MTGPEHNRAKRRCHASMGVAACGQQVDNSGTTLQKLFQLYRQADLCDVQLQVGVRLFHAHRLILSMSSDVFKTMLTDAKWPDARKARIVLNEEPECVKVFGEFLEYMYSGNIHLNNTSVLPVLTLADKYNIHDLGKVCKQYMAAHCHASLANLKDSDFTLIPPMYMKALNDGQVVSWLQYALLCNDEDLESALRRYIELNFHYVMESEDFLTMRQDILDEMLHCQRLVVHSEYSLFVGLKRWLQHNAGTPPTGTRSKADGRAEKTTLQILSHIRLPLMKHAQLLILQSDLFVQKHADFFAPKLQAAWIVHMYPYCKSPLEGSRTRHGQSPESSGNFTSQSVSGSRTSLWHNSDSSPACSDGSGCDCSERVFPVCCSEQSLVLMGGCENAAEFLSSTESDRVGCLQRCASPSERLMDSLMPSPLSGIILPSSSRGGYAYYTPRNYTCDDWSTSLTIEEFAEFPQYGSHTYFFSTPTSVVPTSSSTACRCSVGGERLEETDDSSVLEWQVELYPKGVRFPRAKMIGIPENYDIDENCREVVRLAVSSKTQHQQPCRVDISVLAVATGIEDGSEYMEALAHKCCIFDKEHTLYNIDNIVPFVDLNCAGSKYLTEGVAGHGSGRTSFKVVVIIKPSQ